MFNIYMLISMIIVVLLMSIFFFVSKKVFDSNFSVGAYECGFSAYFFSRYSYSSHYFMVALIFLFLDLELCMIIPFFSDFNPDHYGFYIVLMFISILLFGLIFEWFEGKLNWVS